MPDELERAMFAILKTEQAQALEAAHILEDDSPHARFEDGFDAGVVAAQERIREAERLRADIQKLGTAFATLHMQGLNGVVCDPCAEPGRLGCASCLGAWKDGGDVLARYDPKWGNLHRPKIFDGAALDANPREAERPVLCDACNVRPERIGEHRCCGRDTLGCNCDCQEPLCRMQRGEVTLAELEAEDEADANPREDED